MGFKNLSITVALLFAFSSYLEVQAAIGRETFEIASSSTGAQCSCHHLVVHDASKEKLVDIHHTPFKQISPISVPDTFHGTVLEVMRGKGVKFQRADPVQDKWYRFLNIYGVRKRLEDHLLKVFKWDGPYPVKEEPEMIDERHVNDGRWVHFGPAPFPVRLPVDTQHNILSLRAPMTTKKCLEPVGKEIPPADYEEWMKNPEAYIEFIHGHDFFATNVHLSEEELGQEGLASFLMKQVDSDELERAVMTKDEQEEAEAARVASEASGGEYAGEHIGSATDKMEDPPHLKRAKGAMLWSGRNIVRLIAAKYPGRRFSCFRVNRFLRTHDLNEIHIFLEKTPEEIEAARIEALRLGR